MKNIFLTFIILNSICVFAQSEKLILTKNENTKWFQSLNSTNELSLKVDLINQRLINDINVYIKWEFPDGMTVERMPKLDSIGKIRSKGFCKPLYIIKYKSKNIPFRIENPMNNVSTNSVNKLLNTNNICGVEVWNDDERQVLYGTSGDCGIIFIKTNKRKVFRAFKKLELPSFYRDEIANY